MAAFDPGHPLSFTLGVLGNFVSFVVYLAPLPTFIQIYRNKSILGFQSLPYVVALFSSMVWMYYALVKGNAILIITINSFGCLVETIYIVIFLTYATKEARKHTSKLLGCLNVALFSAIIFVAQFLVKDSSRTDVVGWIGVAISIGVFAAPLSVVVQVIRTKSVEFMPIGLSGWLTLSAVMWLAYGLTIEDVHVALPNVFGFVLGLVQMILYAIYRKAKKQEISIEKEEEEKPQEGVINIVILEGPEQVNQKSDDANKTAMGGQIGHKMDGDGKEYEKKKNNEKSSAKVEEEAAHEPCRVNVQLVDSPILITCVA